MGTVMAANLAAAGHPVVAYVRRPDQMDTLRRDWPQADNENHQTCSICEFVISMLPDDDAVRDVVLGQTGPRHCRSRRGIEARRYSSFDEHYKHIHCGSFGARACTSRARLRRSAGVWKSGCRQGASALRCRRRRRGRCRTLSAAIRHSRTEEHLLIGTDPGHANLVKLLGNMMTATTLEMLGEVVAVALKRGLDPKSFHRHHDKHDVRRTRAQDLWGQDRQPDRTHPDSSCPWCSRMCVWRSPRQKARATPMPSVNVVRDRLITGIARGYADLDWTALGLIAAEEAGLQASTTLNLN